MRVPDSDSDDHNRLSPPPLSPQSDYSILSSLDALSLSTTSFAPLSSASASSVGRSRDRQTSGGSISGDYGVSSFHSSTSAWTSIGAESVDGQGGSRRTSSGSLASHGGVGHERRISNGSGASYDVISEHEVEASPNLNLRQLRQEEEDEERVVFVPRGFATRGGEEILPPTTPTASSSLLRQEQQQHNKRPVSQEQGQPSITAASNQSTTASTQPQSTGQPLIPYSDSSAHSVAETSTHSSGALPSSSCNDDAQVNRQAEHQAKGGTRRSGRQAKRRTENIAAREAVDGLLGSVRPTNPFDSISVGDSSSSTSRRAAPSHHQLRTSQTSRRLPHVRQPSAPSSSSSSSSLSSRSSRSSDLMYTGSSADEDEDDADEVDALFDLITDSESLPSGQVTPTASASRSGSRYETSGSSVMSAEDARSSIDE